MENEENVRGGERNSGDPGGVAGTVALGRATAGAVSRAGMTGDTVWISAKELSRQRD